MHIRIVLHRIITAMQTAIVEQAAQVMQIMQVTQVIQVTQEMLQKTALKIQHPAHQKIQQVVQPQIIQIVQTTLQTNINSNRSDFEMFLS